jgi:rhodanese-related sulfurtransferase
MQLQRNRSGHSALLNGLLCLGFVCMMPCAIGQQAAEELPLAKQTSLGLYLTAKEAYQKWQRNPDSVTVLDVRTTEEFIYVGHAPMARNVPLMSQTYKWNEEKQSFEMRVNPHFVAQVSEFAAPSDTLLVMCRSGGRSALAVNMLADAGYKNVYQIVDGMEGDAIKDPDSVFQGQRLKNGWKNSGNPWTYETAPQYMRFISNETKEKSP